MSDFVRLTPNFGATLSPFGLMLFTDRVEVAGRAALACPLVALAKEEAREERAGESG